MLNLHRHPNDLVTLQSPLLNAVSVPHAFTTRTGGVSHKPFDSLNFQPADHDVAHLIQDGDALSATPDSQADHYHAVVDNVARISTAIGCSNRQLRCIWQIHGSSVVIWPDDMPPRTNASPNRTSNGSPTVVAKADAIITCDRASLIAVRVADCVPILLATSNGTHVAAVHAGWRGIVGGVLSAAVQRLTRAASIPAHGIIAAIGPCISAACFEVGQEVAEAFIAEAFDRQEVGRHQLTLHADREIGRAHV